MESPSRILVVDAAERSLRTMGSTLGALGYEVLAVGDRERLRIELRAGDPGLLLLCAEAGGGAALEWMREAAEYSKAPVPLLVYSSRYKPAELLELAPPELRLVAALPSPVDPADLARTVARLVPAAEGSPAQGKLADLLRDAGAQAVRLEEPSGRYEFVKDPLARLLFGIDRHRWTGALLVRSAEEDLIRFWFDSGQLAYAASAAGRDLIATAKAAGRLDGKVLPGADVKTSDEEVGLLLAVRAIGVHEVEPFQQRTAVRLLGDALGWSRGTASAFAGQAAPQRFRAPMPLLGLLLDAVRQRLSGGDRSQEPNPDASLVVRLPEPELVRGWALPPKERRVVESLAALRGREGTLEAFLASHGGATDEDRLRARSVIAMLREVGYVRLVGPLFDAATNARLDAMLAELHSWRRATHYEVLGIKPEASEKQLRDAMHNLSRRLHPDTMVDQHPRLLVVSHALYARLQEAWDVLKDPARRDAYRDSLREAAGPQGKPSRDATQARVAMFQGRAAMKSKKWAEARDAYRDATLLDPANVQARVLLGWTRFLADPDGAAGLAEADLQEALRGDPKCGDAWLYRGRIAARQGDVAAARKHFEAARKAEPDHVEAGRELRLMDMRGKGPKDAAASGAVAPGSPKSAGLQGLLSRLRKPL